MKISATSTFEISEPSRCAGEPNTNIVGVIDVRPVVDVMAPSGGPRHDVAAASHCLNQHATMIAQRVERNNDNTKRYIREVSAWLAAPQYDDEDDDLFEIGDSARDRLNAEWKKAEADVMALRGMSRCATDAAEQLGEFVVSKTAAFDLDASLCENACQVTFESQEQAEALAGLLGALSDEYALCVKSVAPTVRALASLSDRMRLALASNDNALPPDSERRRVRFAPVDSDGQPIKEV